MINADTVFNVDISDDNEVDMITVFGDVHSGGTQVHPDYSHFVIGLPVNMAIDYMMNKFGIDPEAVSCYCCGEDFYITEYNSFEDLLKDDTYWIDYPETFIDLIEDK